MAQTIPDITVDDTAWVDLNTASGVTVGSKMLITLQSSTWCKLYEGAAAPALDFKGGEKLTDKRYPYNSATIPAGSLKIWALSSDQGRSVKLGIQEL